MPVFPPNFLAEVTGGRWTVEPTVALTGFTNDTRTLRAGEVFVALRSEKRDGHDFLGAAAAAGAGAALVAAPRDNVALPQLVVADPLGALQTIARAHRRAFGGQVVGISGSAGKTSTKDLLALLLGGPASGVVVATEGNLNNTLGVPLTLTRIDPARHAFAVIEAGISEPGEMAVLAGMIEPDLAIITLIAAAHTETLGGIPGVAREKAVLPAATRASGVALFSRETAEHAPFRTLGVRTMIVERTDVLPAAGASGDTVCFALAHQADATVVTLAYGRTAPQPFTLRRVSDGQAQNAALAICAALRLGVPADEIRRRLGDWQPGKLRGEIRRENGRLLYVDCYNANPASMIDALRTFPAVAGDAAPRLYLLGCMAELGPEAPQLHRAVGRAIDLGPNDYVMVIGEHAHEVCAGVLEQGEYAAQIQVVSALPTMAATFAEWPGPVFIKGSRRYQLERILESKPAAPPPC